MAANEAPRGHGVCVGGWLVEQGTLQRSTRQRYCAFVVTDTAQTIPVSYTGLLPDLFKEGKGVVAQGTLESDGVFHASEVLAKHDENYMPPQAKDARSKVTRQMMSEKTLVRPGTKGKTK